MAAALIPLAANSIASATSFSAAVRGIVPALRGFARRLTNDVSSAEDLVQDTLTRAWAARGRFQSGTNLKAWLFRIARNSFLSEARRSRRQVSWDDDLHGGTLVAAAMQDDALYARDLQGALARLPRDQRDALLLIVEEQLSYSDAADTLGIALGTLKSRVARARAAVLAYLGGEAPRMTIPAAPALPTETLAPDLTRYDRWKASGSMLIG